jgi:hypothetical protein
MDLLEVSWGSEEKCTLDRLSARNQIKNQQNWRINGLVLSWEEEAREYECFMFRLTSSLGLNREPKLGKDGRYRRSPPILGSTATRSGSICGGTLGTAVRYKHITPYGRSLFCLYLFVKICNFCRVRYGRAVRPGSPVRLVVVSFVLFDMKFLISISWQWGGTCTSHRTNGRYSHCNLQN